MLILLTSRRTRLPHDHAHLRTLWERAFVQLTDAGQNSKCICTSVFIFRLFKDLFTFKEIGGWGGYHIESTRNVEFTTLVGGFSYRCNAPRGVPSYKIYVYKIFKKEKDYYYYYLFLPLTLLINYYCCYYYYFY